MPRNVSENVARTPLEIPFAQEVAVSEALAVASMLAYILSSPGEGTSMLFLHRWKKT